MVCRCQCVSLLRACVCVIVCVFVRLCGCAGTRAQAYRFAAGGPVIRCTIYFSVNKTYKVVGVTDRRFTICCRSPIPLGGARSP